MVIGVSFFKETDTFGEPSWWTSPIFSGRLESPLLIHSLAALCPFPYPQHSATHQLTFLSSLTLPPPPLSIYLSIYLTIATGGGGSMRRQRWWRHACTRKHDGSTTTTTMTPLGRISRTGDASTSASILSQAAAVAMAVVTTWLNQDRSLVLEMPRPPLLAPVQSPPPHWREPPQPLHPGGLAGAAGIRRAGDEAKDPDCSLFSNWYPFCFFPLGFLNFLGRENVREFML